MSHYPCRTTGTTDEKVIYVNGITYLDHLEKFFWDDYHEHDYVCLLFQ